MNDPDPIKSKLLASIDELASCPQLYAEVPGRGCTRNRKMSFTDTVQMILTMEGDCIKEELYRYFGRHPDAPSRAAFHKQRNKFNNQALPTLFTTFNNYLQRKSF